MNQMNTSIKISKPDIVSKNNLTRMSVPITIGDSKPSLLFIEVESKYSDYLVYEYADPFVFLMLPLAIRKGLDIYTDIPVSERTLHNINNILLPALNKGDSNAHMINIFPGHEKFPAEAVSEQTYSHDKCSGTAVATSVTCGIDSTYSIKKYSSGHYSDMELTHLFVGSLSIDLIGFDKDDDLFSWEKKHPYNFQRYNKVSEMTGLPLIKCFTNFMTFLKDECKINHLRSHTYITLSAILTLKKLFKIYYFPSSYPYTQFSLENNLNDDTGHYELMLLQVMSDDSFSCFSSGAEVDRIQKTKYIMDYPVAHKTLHPCFRPNKNCSNPSCNKCMRSLLTFDYYDKLDYFSEIYDISNYKKRKKEFLKVLIANQGFGFSGFKELFDMYSEKEPELMKKLVDEHNEEISPVPRQKYDKLKAGFDIQTFFLSQDSPKERLIDYFKNHDIKKIYLSGSSTWGIILTGWLSKDFQVFKKQPDIINDCDLIIILASEPSERMRSRKRISKLVSDKNKILTFPNLKKILTT